MRRVRRERPCVGSSHPLLRIDGITGAPRARASFLAEQAEAGLAKATESGTATAGGISPLEAHLQYAAVMCVAAGGASACWSTGLSAGSQFVAVL